MSDSAVGISIASEQSEDFVMIVFNVFFVRIITCMANMFHCKKNFLVAMITKPFVPFCRSMEKLRLYTAYGLFLCLMIITSVEFLRQPIKCTMKARGVVATQPIAERCGFLIVFAFLCLKLFFDLALFFFPTNHHQCPCTRRHLTMKGRVKKVKMIKNRNIEIDVSLGDRLSVLHLKKSFKDYLNADPDNEINGEALMRLFFYMTKLFFYADHQYPFRYITMMRRLQHVKKIKSGKFVIFVSPEDFFRVLHLKKPHKDMPVFFKKSDKQPKDTLKIDPDNKKNGDVVLIIPEYLS